MRPVEFRGPVPPGTPSLTPWTAWVPEPLLEPPGVPLPAILTGVGLPSPVLDDGMPATPLLPRSILDGPAVVGAGSGLLGLPRATAEGCAELFASAGGVAARLTTL